MTGRYRYILGADGRRYCWAVHPTFKCPNADLPAEPAAQGARALELAEGSAALRCDAALLVRVLSRAHGLLAGERRRDDRSRLTEDCAICGRRMSRLGFAYWIAAIAPHDSPAARIQARRGGAGFERVAGPWYAGTKSDARAWARGRISALEP